MRRFRITYGNGDERIIEAPNHGAARARGQDAAIAEHGRSRFLMGADAANIDEPDNLPILITSCEEIQ